MSFLPDFVFDLVPPLPFRVAFVVAAGVAFWVRDRRRSVQPIETSAQQPHDTDIAA